MEKEKRGKQSGGKKKRSTLRFGGNGRRKEERLGQFAGAKLRDRSRSLGISSLSSHALLPLGVPFLSTVSRKTGGTANPQGSSLLVSDPAWPQAIPVICISNNVALVSPKEGPKPRQLLSLPPFPATPCLLHVKKTAAYEWLPSARSLTTSLTSPAPSSSSRATSTKDS